ncbi:MAG: redoxin domain-containing protein [Rubrobacter sp.]|nr:redoxin domain-containing protein [Rubrobacter sp.]
MRSMIPRPFLLVLTLVLVVGAIAFIELRLDAAGTVETQASANDSPNAADQSGQPEAKQMRGQAEEPRKGAGDRGTADQANSASEDTRDHTSSNPEAKGARISRSISRKENEFDLAGEIVAPTGFINADNVSIKQARGEKVILLDFWTYSCINCQNTQPYINRWHERYADDGLMVVGVHTPEFGFEKEYANVEQAVREAGIEYPVVLDNSYATWNAYDQRYWPAMYLIDADGFIRYRHFGEGAYGEMEAKIRELLAEKDRLQE